MKERSALSSFKFHRGLSLPIVITIVVFILTLWARKIIVETISLHETLPIINGFFSIVHVRNPGVAFGLFSKLDPSYRLPILIGISTIAILLIEYLLVKSREDQWMLRLGLALLGGGAIANFYERLIYGEVVDYLDLYLGSYHWPAFNLADVSICSGIGFFILYNFLRGKHQNMKQREG